MGVKTLAGNPEITVKMRRNTRARRITLRISRVDGAVTLTVPRGVSEREALDFAAEKESWIREHLAGRAEQVRVGAGMVLEVNGQRLNLVEGRSRRLEHQGDQLFLPLPAEKGRQHLLAWIKAQARAELSRASDHYAAKLGRTYSKLTLRDTRSRWGSCSSAGALMYSWRLILAPPAVLQYVCAHEVAHLEEMNHSPAFWAVVHDLYGPHKEARQWLRAEGAGLHRYVFEA